MLPWLKARLAILRLFLPRPSLLGVLLPLQAVPIALSLVPPDKLPPPLAPLASFVPWYAWVIGWLLILLVSSLEYSIERKKRFDETSLNFFKAFLDFLIKEGHQLFNFSEEKDFFSKINDWQHRVIQGIAIGLGPDKAHQFFQKVEGKYPVMRAYKESKNLGSSIPLCKALQDNLDELNMMRIELLGIEDEGGKDLAVVGNPDYKPKGPKDGAKGN